MCYSSLWLLNMLERLERSVWFYLSNTGKSCFSFIVGQIGTKLLKNLTFAQILSIMNNGGVERAVLLSSLLFLFVRRSYVVHCSLSEPSTLRRITFWLDGLCSSPPAPALLEIPTTLSLPDESSKKDCNPSGLALCQHLVKGMLRIERSTLGSNWQLTKGGL